MMSMLSQMLLDDDMLGLLPTIEFAANSPDAGAGAPPAGAAPTNKRKAGAAPLSEKQQSVYDAGRLAAAAAEKDRIGAGDEPEPVPEDTKGVCWSKGLRKWRARLQVDGVTLELGVSESKAVCVAARKAAVAALSAFEAPIPAGSASLFTACGRRIATIEDIVPKDFSHLVRCTVNEPKEGTAGRVERFVVEDAHRPTPESAEAMQELTRELHTLCQRIRTKQPQMLNKDDLYIYFCPVALSALKSCQSHVSTRLRVLVERNLVVDSTTLRVAMLRGAIATLTLAVKYFDVRDADVKCACDLHCSSYPNNTLKAGASELDNTFQFFTMCERLSRCASDK